MSEVLIENPVQWSGALRGHTPGIKAAVIGSGFGGLAAAIRMQASGIQTTIFESRDKPGGRAYVYEEQGFTFDAGPTVITAPHCLEDVFAAAGRNLRDYVTLMPVTPFYRLLWDDGYSFDYDGNAESMHRQISARNPADAAGYARFVAYTKRVFDKGYTELAAKPFLNFTDMVKVAPHLAMLRADQSVYKAVSRFIQDEHIREALSFHSLLVGGNPFETSSIYTLIHYLERNWGVYFPKGGTGSLVRAFVKLFQELGGEIRLSCPVTEIELAHGKRGVVHSVSSAEFGAETFDLVVSNADLYHTYGHLYKNHPAAQSMRRKLEKSQWSMSLFVLYFGTDRPYDLAHHTVVFGPRYEGLLKDIFNGPSLPDDFSLYLHAPTVSDPSLAPEGCGTFYVLSPVPHMGKANINWEQEGPVYAEKILASLERHMPGLRKHVVVKRWFTPKDFQSTLNAYQGSAFSVAPTLRQSAWFRPHNKDPKIPGLYIVGAGTHPGAGLPGVINSAKATMSVIASDIAAGQFA